MSWIRHKKLMGQEVATCNLRQTAARFRHAQEIFNFYPQILHNGEFPFIKFCTLKIMLNQKNCDKINRIKFRERGDCCPCPLPWRHVTSQWCLRADFCRNCYRIILLTTSRLGLVILFIFDIHLEWHLWAILTCLFLAAYHNKH